MNDKKNKTILVTGGAGFVGSHLCEQLTDDGHTIISLDNYFTGSKDNHVIGVDYREGHTADVEKIVSEKIDIVFHLGEYSRVAPSLAEPRSVWDLNVIGTLAVLEFWRAQNKDHECKLVYAGSSTRFADDRVDLVEGKDRAPYNFAKYMNTELVHNYGRWYELPYSVAYFYNVYGPRERAGQFDGGYGTIVETFKQHFKKNESCLINGDGSQTRAFTHVADTVSALVLIGEKGEPDEYAISAAEVYSINELADMFDLEKTYGPATESTRSNGAEDTSKLADLGWQQKHKLTEYVSSCKKK